MLVAAAEGKPTAADAAWLSPPLAKPAGLYSSMWGRQADAQTEAQKRGGELSCHGCKCCVETACECCGKHQA